MWFSQRSGCCWRLPGRWEIGKLHSNVFGGYSPSGDSSLSHLYGVAPEEDVISWDAEPWQTRAPQAQRVSIQWPPEFVDHPDEAITRSRGGRFPGMGIRLARTYVPGRSRFRRVSTVHKVLPRMQERRLAERLGTRREALRGRWQRMADTLAPRMRRLFLGQKGL